MNAQESAATPLPEAWQSYQRGDFARAEQLGRQALAAKRDQPEVLVLLGTVAYRTGQIDAAIAWLLQAVRADPGNADHYLNLGAFHTTANRPAEAVACYQQALRLRPNSAVAFSNQSYALYLLGRMEQARTSAEQALRLQPDLAAAHNHLGLALQGLSWSEAAAEHFRHALRLQPGLMEVRRNLGNTLEEQGLLAEAAACHRETLRLKPDFAEVHSHLGDVLKKLGDFEAAVAHMREALRLKPEYAFVYWNLGQFAAQGLHRFSKEEVGRMLAMVEGGRLSLLEGSLVHLTLGNVLDLQGSYDKAFSHYRQGNALRREWLRQTGQAFDPAAHHDLVNRLITTFDAAFIRQRQSRGSVSELPVFVVGMPRSGTTLVEQILSSHSKVAGAGELRGIEQMVNILAQQQAALGGYPACMSSYDGQHLRDLAETYLGRLARIGGPAIRVIDKSPDNALHLGLIALLFPQARVIHCHRDPLDVCLSCYFQHFTKVDYSWSLEDLGHYHQEHQRIMAHWRRLQPLRLFEVSYEDLVSHQEKVSRDLIAFCGLDWEDRCLDFHKNRRPVQTVSAVQVRRPMYASSVGRWRHYAAHLSPLRQALGLPVE